MSYFLAIEISIFLTWDNFKGYVLTKSNLALFWQWLAAWNQALVSVEEGSVFFSKFATPDIWN